MGSRRRRAKRRARAFVAAGRTYGPRASPAAPVLLAPPLTVALPGLAAALPEAHGRWRGPLPGGRVIARFTYDHGAPFARGARRGIDLSGAPGAPVLAACAGTVVFAGAVPGDGARATRGVTLACARGALRATELGLSAIGVRRGARVVAGALVGRLGPVGVLRLGARHAGDARGYVDPEPLLTGPAARPRSPAPPPAWRAGRRAPPGVPVRRRPPADMPRPATARTPWPAWAGLALLAGGAAGGATTTRRRRRARARRSVAHRYR